MASIAEMLAKKKAAEKKTETPVSHPASAIEHPSNSTPETPTQSAPALTPLQQAMQARNGAGVAGNAPKTGGVVFGIKKPQVAPVGAAAVAKETPPETSVSAPEATDGGETVEEEAGNSDTSTVSHFNHPTQPDAMPASIEEDLKKSLEMIKSQFDDKPLVGQAIPHIMRTLQENPNLRGVLALEDIGMMVRALRECYGVAVTEKVQKKEKRTVAAKEKSEAAKELDGIFNELGIDL